MCRGVCVGVCCVFPVAWVHTSRCEVPRDTSHRATCITRFDLVTQSHTGASTHAQTQRTTPTCMHPPITTAHIQGTPWPSTMCLHRPSTPTHLFLPRTRCVAVTAICIRRLLDASSHSPAGKKHSKSTPYNDISIHMDTCTHGARLPRYWCTPAVKAVPYIQIT